MQAARAMRLSAPYSLTVSVKSPSEPPPEKGRRSARGKISEGMPSFSVKGDKNAEKEAKSPDSLSIADIESTAIMGGRIEINILSPSSAPSKKSW